MASDWLAGLLAVNEPPEVKTKMTITLKHEDPIKSAPRRLSVADNEKLKGIVDDLLNKGSIRASNSPYASSVMPTEIKKEGEYGIMVDYFELNNATVRESHLPRDVDDYRKRLSYNKVYSRYRVKRDFHLVKMAEDSIKYTSFVTNFGQFEFLVMPFGLMNASCVFQKFLYEIFAPMIEDKRIILHMEDIYIATKTHDEHADLIDEINGVIDRYQLPMVEDKCHVLENEISFMGYFIDEWGARYDASLCSSDDDDYGEDNGDDDEY